MTQHRTEQTTKKKEKLSILDELVNHKQTFSLSVRVYYEDTDAGGVVYHSNYINFFERARTEWLRDIGYEQDELVIEHQLVFVVRSLDCEYLRPAKFNDELFVTAGIRELRKTGITFEQQVIRATTDNEKDKFGSYIVLAKGNVKVVAVDSNKFVAKRLPNFLIENIKESTK